MKISFLSILFLVLIQDAKAESYLKFNTNNDYSGNDYGYTGSVLFEYGEIDSDGWSRTYRFDSSLYSRRVIPYGNPANPQYQVFTGWDRVPSDIIARPKGVQDEQIEQNTTLSMTLGFHPANQWWGYSIEGGMTQTESRSGYIPGAAGFQQLLHHTFHAIDYTIISDGRPSRYGVFIKPTVDARYEFLNANAGFSLDTEGRRQFLFSSVAARVWYLTTTFEGQASSNHKQVTVSEDLHLNFGQTVVTLGVVAPLTQTGYADLYETEYIDQDIFFRAGVTVWLK